MLNKEEVARRKRNSSTSHKEECFISSRQADGQKSSYPHHVIVYDIKVLALPWLLLPYWILELHWLRDCVIIVRKCPVLENYLIFPSVSDIHYLYNKEESRLFYEV